MYEQGQTVNDHRGQMVNGQSADEENLNKLTETSRRRIEEQKRGSHDEITPKQHIAFISRKDNEK